ncbi:hypothetical protein P4I20_02630 [Paenibacillus graminis]
MDSDCNVAILAIHAALAGQFLAYCTPYRSRRSLLVGFEFIANMMGLQLFKQVEYITDMEQPYDSGKYFHHAFCQAGGVFTHGAAAEIAGGNQTGMGCKRSDTVSPA